MNQSKKLQVYRVDVSAYQSRDYLDKESKRFNELEGVSYETAPDEQNNVLITNSHTDFSRIQKDNIELIVHPNSGYDNIPASFVKEFNGKIVVGNSIRAQSVSNYILSAFFENLATIPKFPKWDKQRNWERSISSQVTVQLIGLGHIGKILKNVLSNLGCNVLVFDPFLNEHALHLDRADYLIFSCGLNETSKYFLNSKNIDQLKEDVCIINAARGKLIEEAPLLNFLRENKKAFAYLDVFNEEPTDFSRFIELKNTKVSSHIAGVYTGLDNDIMEFVFQVVKDFSLLGDDDFDEKYKDSILKNKLRDHLLI